jgi:peptide-methionine (S)-S-oxide reductase
MKYLFIIIGLTGAFTGCSQPVQKQNIMNKDLSQFSVATLGAGCFWCVEAVFQRLKGVDTVISGYAGGKTDKPTYKEVCSGTTGHAEVAQIYYNPNVISFEELLEVFFNTHDPTQLNRQGHDVGTQYRSVIFYNNDSEKQIAEAYKKQIAESGIFSQPVVTEISPLPKFFPAEDYHQNYFNLNGSQSYCEYVVRPKVEKFQKQFKEKLK